MHHPKAVADASTPHSATLAAIAASNRLVVCIGAGFSVAPPTDLPPGPALAQAVHTRLEVLLPGLPACDATSLTSVADAAATLPTGLDLVRRTCLEVADFTTVTPNHAHKVVAALLLEGALSVLSWNWDTCIERSGNGEQILTIVTDDDRRDIADAALLKFHGCAFRPPTMLITTADLESPRNWAEAEMNGRLVDSVVVFVGIGDVAGYTRLQMEKVAQAVGDVNHVFVVSPGIVDDWDNSMWSELVPNLPEDNRIAATAEDFLESLAASILMAHLTAVEQAASGHPPLAAAAAKASQLVQSSDALTVLQFSRRCGLRVRAGSPCLLSNNGHRALLAVGLKIPDGVDPTLSASHVGVQDLRVAVLVSADDRAAGDFAREARARLVELRNEGYAGAVEFLCSGALGPLPPGGPGDIVATISDADIVGGAHAEEPVLISAGVLLEAA